MKFFSRERVTSFCVGISLVFLILSLYSIPVLERILRFIGLISWIIGGIIVVAYPQEQNSTAKPEINYHALGIALLLGFFLSVLFFME